jgi:hypothetical protein
MTSNPLAEIVLAACQMKAMHPQEFQRMVDAFRALEITAISELLAGDAPHDMFRAQGRVKTVQQVRKHLQECNELRDKYTRRDQNARPNP